MEEAPPKHEEEVFALRFSVAEGEAKIKKLWEKNLKLKSELEIGQEQIAELKKLLEDKDEGPEFLEVAHGGAVLGSKQVGH